MLLQMLPDDLLPFHILHCCWLFIVPTLMAYTAARHHYCHHCQFIVDLNYFITVANITVTALSLPVALTDIVTML